MSSTVQFVGGVVLKDTLMLFCVPSMFVCGPVSNLVCGIWSMHCTRVGGAGSVKCWAAICCLLLLLNMATLCIGCQGATNPMALTM